MAINVTAFFFTIVLEKNVLLSDDIGGNDRLIEDTKLDNIIGTGTIVIVL